MKKWYRRLNDSGYFVHTCEDGRWLEEIGPYGQDDDYGEVGGTLSDDDELLTDQETLMVEESYTNIATAMKEIEKTEIEFYKRIRNAQRILLNLKRRERNAQLV